MPRARLLLYGEDHSDRTGLDILSFYGVEVVYLSLGPLIEDWVRPSLREYLAVNAAAAPPASSVSKESPTRGVASELLIRPL